MAIRYESPAKESQQAELDLRCLSKDEEIWESVVAVYSMEVSAELRRYLVSDGTQTFRYQDFVDEHRAGEINGAFIDELRDTPSHLHAQRKSWVAVVARSVIEPAPRLSANPPALAPTQNPQRPRRVRPE